MKRLFELTWLLDYERRLAERYRYFLSLVMVSSLKQKVDIVELLAPTMRSCEMIFSSDNEYAILMPHTSEHEAQIAITRYKTMCNGEIDLRFSVTCYPDDISSITDPIQIGRRRLEIARRSGTSEVISTG